MSLGNGQSISAGGAAATTPDRKIAGAGLALAHLPVTVQILLGSTRMQLSELMELKAGHEIGLHTPSETSSLREEIQRAFILHRFDQRLGGGLVGVIAFGIAFGLGHYVQGWSVVIITALLGMLWSVVYLARRSVIAPMVSHASFNLIEVIGFGLVACAGWA
jgi:membrane protease YdiL (CAAX protease family)